MGGIKSPPKSVGSFTFLHELKIKELKNRTVEAITRLFLFTILSSLITWSQDRHTTVNSLLNQIPGYIVRFSYREL